MKKVIIAACMVAIATAVQASSFNWKTAASGGALYSGDSTTKYSGTAYLFSTADFTQQAILSAWDSGTFATDKAVASKSVSEGKIASTTTPFNGFEWGSAGDTLTAFVVVDAGDKIFISSALNADAQEATTVTMQYKLTAGSQVDPIEFEAGSAKFSAQGWYKSTGSVPEPTSGLLLVLGMAGLALRRRRA